MAFFNFKSYTKEGPGVRENEPEKKRFFQFWDIFGRKFWNMMTLNLLYIVCCLPIVTIGPATAGLIYVLRNYVNGVPTLLKEDFFEAFKRNWKVSFGVSIINTVIALVGSYAIYFYNYLYKETDSFFYFISLIAVFSVMLIVLFMNYYIHIMIVTFDLSFKKLVKNAFIFAGIGLGPNLIITISLGLILGVFYLIFMFFPMVAIPLAIFTLAPFCGLIIVFNAFPLIKKHIIDPFYSENNLENPLDKELNKDSIFKDVE